MSTIALHLIQQMTAKRIDLMTPKANDQYQICNLKSTLCPLSSFPVSPRLRVPVSLRRFESASSISLCSMPYANTEGRISSGFMPSLVI